LHAVELGADGYLFKEDYLLDQNSRQKFMKLVGEFISEI